MEDLQSRILEVVSGPTLAGFSTIDKEGKPWVRYVMTEASDDLSFRFSSFTNARKVAQIHNNPEVHLTCGITSPISMTSPYLQIQGRAEFTTELKARQEFWSERLRILFDGPEDPNFGVVIVRAYRIEYCVVGVQPEVWERDGFKQAMTSEPSPTARWCDCWLD
jgi:general stress protein 26